MRAVRFVVGVLAAGLLLYSGSGLADGGNAGACCTAGDQCSGALICREATCIAGEQNLGSGEIIPILMPGTCDQFPLM